MEKVVLANHYNYTQIEEEERYEFTIYVLSYFGIPEESLKKCFPEGGFKDFTVQHKKALRSLLSKFNIHIMDNNDGEFKIYMDNILIAHWKKSTYKLSRDVSKKKISDQLYVEIYCDFWIKGDSEK